MPRSPAAAVILSLLVTAEKPASVIVQSAMMARWPGLFIHQLTAAPAAPPRPVPPKMISL